MGTAKWRECATATQQLAMNIDEYCKYLHNQLEKQQSRHISQTPLRFPSDGKSSHVSSIVGGLVRSTRLIERYNVNAYKCYLAIMCMQCMCMQLRPQCICMCIIICIVCI